MTNLQRNLANLNAFWLAFANTQENGVQRHIAWPNKVWQSDFKTLDETSWQGNVCVTTLPTVLQKKNISNSLIAMTLQTSKLSGSKSESIEIISTLEQLKKWALTCAEAFGYEIDYRALEPLLTNSDAKIFAFIDQGKIAGTAIAYISNGTLGIHQVGVPACNQGKGIGKALMQHLLWFAGQQNCDLISLQASQAGLPMYLAMGFTEQGTCYHLKQSN
ncbi:GNAT family N-acetyltransferase [Pseudoalteromonas sp. SSM20]|uniref:GNAT family N-acetyltransferase n=1 Tax=Pseudoalteromonas sp. SSM20 TaxID=3139394 RepID=UPI003BA8DDBD